MLPSTSVSATPPEQRLADLYAALGEVDRHALLAFAEFLAAGGPRPAPAHIPAPESAPEPPAGPAAARFATPAPLPRPPEERVIAAIRRLGVGYPMLERGAMLHETAALMSQHVVQGRPAAAVIDDLEALFERHYQAHCRRLPGAEAGPDDTPRGAAPGLPHG